MRAERALLRIGEYLVGRACQQLPPGMRQRRYREWAAELPVILHDPQIGPAPRRAIRMLGYAADTVRGAALTRVRARRLRPGMTATLCVLLVADLAITAWDVRDIVAAPGDPLNYLRLVWGVLLLAYPLSVLMRSASRVSLLIACGGTLAGAGVNLWDAARAAADWVNYFVAALLLLVLILGVGIVSRRARTKQT
jgi:hypothetical protein